MHVASRAATAPLAGSGTAGCLSPAVGIGKVPKHFRDGGRFYTDGSGGHTGSSSRSDGVEWG